MLIRCVYDRLLRRCHTTMLCILLFAAAKAQTPDNGKHLVGDRLQRIPLDRNDPEVQAIRRRRPLGLFQNHLSQGDNRFLVDLDPSKASTSGPMLSRQLRGDRSVQGRKTVSYDKKDAQATEFIIEYPSLKAQLRCYWAYDRRLANLLAVADAKAREAALERNARHSLGRVQRLGAAPSGKESKLSNRSQLLVSADPELGTLIRVRRQFKKAGRPCQIELVCFSDVSNQETFAKRIQLNQRERKACIARADQLVAAMRIVRTGE